MKIGYFCTAGYTEVNGIEPLLRRINPRVHWARLFPHLTRPGPKPTRSDTPGERRPKTHEGATGQQLVRLMLERIRDFPDPSVDAWLLIDDEDCRFCPKPTGPKAGEEILRMLVGYRQELTATIAAVGVEVKPLFLLLALPEVEAWLLADPGGIERHLREQGLATAPHALRLFLQERQPLEAFGCPRVGPSCDRKLSDDLSDWLAMQPPVEDRPLRYSKRLDGPVLLSRLDPDAVARRGMPWFEACVRPLQRLV